MLQELTKDREFRNRSRQRLKLAQESVCPPVFEEELDLARGLLMSEGILLHSNFLSDAFSVPGFSVTLKK